MSLKQLIPTKASVVVDVVLKLLALYVWSNSILLSITLIVLIEEYYPKVLSWVDETYVNWKEAQVMPK